MSKKGAFHHSDKKGFSLIEVLLSIAFFAVLVFAGTAWMQVLNKDAASSNENIAISNVMNHVRYAFGDDPKYCQKIVATQADGSARSFDFTNTAGISIPSIDYYNIDANTKGPNVVALNMPLIKANGGISAPGVDGVNLASIQLVPVSITSPTTGLANLEFNFVKPGTQQQILRKLPLYITLAAGKISTCSTYAVTNVMAQTVSTRQCEISSGGFTKINPTTGACEVDPALAKWYPSSDPLSATCPTGTVPAAPAGTDDPQLSVCRTGATFTTPLPPRVYAGGVVDVSPDIGWRIISFDMAAGRCNFGYVVGAAPNPGETAILCTTAGAK
jgi:prepilin-type N-terminal cleavage/methylation domain-containing protein